MEGSPRFILSGTAVLQRYHKQPQVVEQRQTAVVLSRYSFLSGLRWPHLLTSCRHTQQQTMSRDKEVIAIGVATLIAHFPQT